MASLNCVHLIGNSTKDSEVKYTAGGMAIAEFGLAVNDRRKKGEEYVEEVTFVDVTLFGKQAEIAGEYITKGKQVYIQGRLKLDQWETDGQKRSKLHVIGENFQLLGSKGDSAPAPKEEAKPAKAKTPAKKPKATEIAEDGEVPF